MIGFVLVLEFERDPRVYPGVAGCQSCLWDRVSWITRIIRPTKTRTILLRLGRMVRVRVSLAQVRLITAREVIAARGDSQDGGFGEDVHQMGNRFINSAIVVAAVSLTPVPVAGQAPAAKPQAYTAPRTPDGKPDLQGMWQVLNTAAWDIQDHHARLDVPAGQGVVEGNDIPYQPWVAAKKKENFENRLTADPVRKCYLPGVPRITYLPYPFQGSFSASSGWTTGRQN